MALDDAESEDPPKKPLVSLKSPDVEVRRKAMQAIALEQLRVAEALLGIIRSPRLEEGDGWLDVESSRNLAIGMVGALRVENPVVMEVLSQHLERPEGEEAPMVIDRPFHLCPAARAFISIGQPSTEKMLEILATTSDVDRMRADQARLIIYYIEGNAEGERMLTLAAKDEQDPERQKALQAHLEVFRTIKN